jgi:uncharacterized protein YcnI
MRRHFTRGAVIATGAALFVGLGATVASAHVTIDPDTAAQGGYAALVFRVPNERDNADTVKIDVRLPPDRPLASVHVKPHPGWSYEIRKTRPATPDEYDEFAISAGPLPKSDSMIFKTLQYYSDGEVVRWIQEPLPNAAEPERPAPVLKLLPPSKTGAARPAGGPVRDSGGRTAAEADHAVASWALGLSLAAMVVAFASAAMAIRASRR